ncbi:glucose n-acetyltransferase 1 [Fusarium avenaceum]|nr:glucose n-acetyltransferase 1 [Fusarium avenaceum]
MLASTNRLLRLLPAILLIITCFLFVSTLQQGNQENALGDSWWAYNEGQKDAESPATTTPLVSEEKPIQDYEKDLDEMDKELEEYEQEMTRVSEDGKDDGKDDDEDDDEDNDDDRDEIQDLDAAGGEVPDFTRLNNSVLYPTKDGVDWGKFAYIQYVTDEDYLCNSVMAFETLDRLRSRADRLMMYPGEMLAPDAEESDTVAGQLLIKARDEYNVKLQPIEIQRREGDDLTWAESFTKLLIFNQTQYDRVLYLDSDGMVLQPMDELFKLPPCPVAMPRAYWLYQDEHPSKVLSSQLMVVQPSKVEFERILEKMETIEGNDYDMEIVNELYLDSALVLPHRQYNMLSAEYRRENHSDYLGSDREEWDPIAAYNEAKFVHFSDWPVPKPWIQDLDLRLEHEPQCHMVGDELSCTEREIWNKLYTDFAVTRKRVCKTVDKSKLKEEKEKANSWGFGFSRS